MLSTKGDHEGLQGQTTGKNPFWSGLDRVGAGEERTRGGDACIALDGRTLPRPGRCKHPLPASAPPPPLRDLRRSNPLYKRIPKKPTSARTTRILAPTITMNQNCF